MKKKQKSVFAVLVLMITVMAAVSLTGCDKNDEPGIEPGENYQDYPWYVDPDTTRGEDGQLYFHYDVWSPTSPGLPHPFPRCAFVERVNGFSITGPIYVTQDNNRWLFDIILSGDYISMEDNFEEFKERCVKYGIRPYNRTPYDPELQKIRPCMEWKSYVQSILDGSNIKDIRIITQSDFDAAHPAGSDLSDIMWLQAYMFDDMLKWQNEHLTYPLGYYYGEEDYPGSTFTRMPISQFLESPHLLRLQYLGDICMGCYVIPAPGKYDLTIKITSANGNECEVTSQLRVHGQTQK